MVGSLAEVARLNYLKSLSGIETLSSKSFLEKTETSQARYCMRCASLTCTWYPGKYVFLL